MKDKGGEMKQEGALMDEFVDKQRKSARRKHLFILYGFLILNLVLVVTCLYGIYLLKHDDPDFPKIVWTISVFLGAVAAYSIWRTLERVRKNSS
jgi:uncharacterized membrane protein YfcA